MVAIYRATSIILVLFGILGSLVALNLNIEKDHLKILDCKTFDGRDCVKWEECDKLSCVIACLSIKKTRCIFPFKFNGTTYRQCTRQSIKEEPWCATKVSPISKKVLKKTECFMETCPLD